MLLRLLHNFIILVNIAQLLCIIAYWTTRGCAKSRTSHLTDGLTHRLYQAFVSDGTKTVCPKPQLRQWRPRHTTVKMRLRPWKYCLERLSWDQGSNQDLHDSCSNFINLPRLVNRHVEDTHDVSTFVTFIVPVVCYFHFVHLFGTVIEYFMEKRLNSVTISETFRYTISLFYGKMSFERCFYCNFVRCWVFFKIN